MTKSRAMSEERSPRRGRSSSPFRSKSSFSSPLVLELPFPPRMFRPALITWYHGNDRQLPWRTFWSEKRDPYHVWVSEIMLQQTVIKAVIPVYERFIAQFPTVLHLAKASEDDVRSAVRGLGYYRRFRMLHEAAKEIAQAKGQWPTTFDGWKSLPGVGDYTAAAVSSIAFDESAAVVDGNVERVLCRLLDLQVSPAEPGLKTVFKRLAQEFLDPTRPGDFNQALMELGQLCCTVTAPSCSHCPLAKGCLAQARGTQSLAPQPKVRPKAIKVALRLGIILHEGRIALVERPSGAKFLRESWGFLTGLATEEGHYRWDGRDSTRLMRALSEAQPLKKTVKHMITKHQIEAQVVPLEKSVLAHATAVRWFHWSAVETALVSSLDQKAWKLFLRETRIP